MKTLVSPVFRSAEEGKEGKEEKNTERQKCERVKEERKKERKHIITYILHLISNLNLQKDNKLQTSE